MRLPWVVHEPLERRQSWLDGLSVVCILVWLLIARLLVLGGYGTILVSVTSWSRLTKNVWCWVAASPWWKVMLSFLGALVCLLLIVGLLFAAREALLFFLAVALLAGLALRALLPIPPAPAGVLPPPTDIVPLILAVGLAASFVFAGSLDSLHDVGRLLLAALFVVPGAVLLGLLVAALLPMPAAAVGRPKKVWLVLASLLVVLELVGLVRVGGWEGLVVLGAIFALGFLLVWFIQGPITLAKALYKAALPPPAPPAPIGPWLKLGNFAGVLAAPLYFTVALYLLLSF